MILLGVFIIASISAIIAIVIALQPESEKTQTSTPCECERFELFIRQSEQIKFSNIQSYHLHSGSIAICF